MMRHLFAFLLVTVAGAQEPPETAPTPSSQDFRVEMPCITLPQKLALPLIRRLRGAPIAEHARAMAELEGLLEQGKATLAGWPSLIVPEGRKASYASSELLYFATEFQPVWLAVPMREEHGRITKLPPGDPNRELESIGVSFEARNLALSLEVLVNTRPEDGSLLIEFTAIHSRLKSIDRLILEQDTAAGKEPRKSVAEQPRFHTMKVSASVAMMGGDHRLMGIFPTPNGENMLELFILTAERLVKTESRVKKGGK